MECRQCGKEIPEDSDFCVHCGAPVAPATAGGGEETPPPTQPAAPQPPQASAPPPPQGAPPPPGGPPPPPPLQPGPYQPKPKRSALPWILGGVGLAVIAAVVLILVFVVFKSDNGGGASEPERVVDAFFQSIENKDVDLMLSTMEPDFVVALEDYLGADYKELLDTYFMAALPEDISFSGVEYKSEVEGDTATVDVVAGTVSYTDEYGDKVSEEAEAGDMGLLELVRIDGKWYLSTRTLEETLNFDLSGAQEFEEDLDLGEDDLDYGEDYDYDTLPVDSEDEALYLVWEAYPEVYDWYFETVSADYEISDENTSYVFHFFEEVDGEQVTYAWYAVDKETGEVTEVTE